MRQAARTLHFGADSADREGLEAARIPWRPLGRLLVEQGLLTDDELELALAAQERTGKRLGETIVECGFVSGPELSSALASQYGIELTTESGFGTGLRSKIQRRHESERGRVLRPVLVDATDAVEDAAVEGQPEPAGVEPDERREALLLAQLEEQWAKLAAAEARLADGEVELAVAGRDRWRRRAQVGRFVRRVRVRDERLRQLLDEFDALTTVAEQLLAQVEQLSTQARGRDEELARLRQAEARAAERSGRLDTSLGEIERLTSDIRGRDEEIERLRAQVAMAAGVGVGHLVLVQLCDRYELVERSGPAPQPGSELELPDLYDGVFVVVRSGRSPLPGDARPCVFAQFIIIIRSS